MNNIIYIKKEQDNYFLSYKNLKEICYIGKNGLTKEKKEGDLKTPIGQFKLGLIFGVHKKEEINMNKTLNYIEMNKNLYWVDDINSKYYNQLVNITKVTKDWNSAENLLENKEPYEYAIEIKTNPTNIPGRGSAIFLHCKRKNYTAGCISINRDKMISLLSMIDSDTQIKIS